MAGPQQTPMDHMEPQEGDTGGTQTTRGDHGGSHTLSDPPAPPPEPPDLPRAPPDLACPAPPRDLISVFVVTFDPKEGTEGEWESVFVVFVVCLQGQGLGVILYIIFSNVIYGDFGMY